MTCTCNMKLCWTRSVSNGQIWQRTSSREWHKLPKKSTIWRKLGRRRSKITKTWDKKSKIKSMSTVNMKKLTRNKWMFTSLKWAKSRSSSRESWRNESALSLKKLRRRRVNMIEHAPTYKLWATKSRTSCKSSRRWKRRLTSPQQTFPTSKWTQTLVRPRSWP